MADEVHQDEPLLDATRPNEAAEGGDLAGPAHDEPVAVAPQDVTEGGDGQTLEILRATRRRKGFRRLRQEMLRAKPFRHVTHATKAVTLPRQGRDDGADRPARGTRAKRRRVSQPCRVPTQHALMQRLGRDGRAGRAQAHAKPASHACGRVHPWHPEPLARLRHRDTSFRARRGADATAMAGLRPRYVLDTLAVLGHKHILFSHVGDETQKTPHNGYEQNGKRHHTPLPNLRHRQLSCKARHDLPVA